MEQTQNNSIGECNSFKRKLGNITYYELVKKNKHRDEHNNSYDYT